MKKVLAIVSSPRKGGNSELLVDEFVKGAAAAGNTVEKLCLREKKIAPCLACEACLRNGGICVQNDDMGVVLAKLIDADVIVLSTPVSKKYRDAARRTPWRSKHWQYGKSNGIRRSLQRNKVGRA